MTRFLIVRVKIGKQNQHVSHAVDLISSKFNLLEIQQANANTIWPSVCCFMCKA